MGNVGSMCRDNHNNRPSIISDNGYLNGNPINLKLSASAKSPNDQLFLTSEEQDQELEFLRRIIEHNPELFILNHLMMCIHFFDNYEETISNMKHTLVSPREKKLNTRLPPQKHVLLPDVLEEQVSQNVSFMSIQPSLMIPSMEPLQPHRIYIVYDNIEVTEQNFSTPYCNVNQAITYYMQLKQSKHRGYALLQRLEVIPCQKKETTVTAVYNESKDDENDDSSSVDDNRLHVDNKLTHNINNNNINNTNNNNNNNKNKISLLNRTIDSMKSDIRGSGSLKSTLTSLRHEDNDNIYSANDKLRSTEEIPDVQSRGKNPGRIDPMVIHSKDIGSNRTSPAESTSSGYRSGQYTIDSDSDDVIYNFSTSTSINSGQKLRATAEDISSEVPRDCFEIYNPKKNKKQKFHRDDQIFKNVIHYNPIQYDVWYLGSQKFMEHFYKCFTSKLSLLMGFDLATTRITPTTASVFNDTAEIAGNSNFGPVIYCDTYEPLQATSPTPSSLSSASHPSLQSQQEYLHKLAMKTRKFAVLPCVWAPWPEIADEWIERPRMWPHYNVIEKIKEIGCYLIPKSYIDDKDSAHNLGNSNMNSGSNTLRGLEWEVTFPGAERYLETCLTYSQIRVYLMALLLQKTFIPSAAVDSCLGLTGSHIRNQLFWLLEENDKPSKWLDNRMGEALMRLLNSLYKCISQDVPFMRDYFIRDKNIFQGKIYLLRTQKQLKRIIENPVMYLLHAMQNIKYRSNFFPMLDYNGLMKILTDDILTLMNPHIPLKFGNRKNQNSEYDYYATHGNLNEDEKNIKNRGADGSNHHGYGNSSDGGFWNNAKHVKQTNNVLRRPVANKPLIDTRISYDQVLEISVRCAELQEPRRICMLLDLFIRHFIKIAECCHKFGSSAQQSVYVDQAIRLSILLSEYSAKGLKMHETGRHIEENVKLYMDKLHALKRRPNRVNNVNRRSANNGVNLQSGPDLPPQPPLPPLPPLTSLPHDNTPKKERTTRDSPIFSTRLNERFNNKNISINNTDNSNNKIGQVQKSDKFIDSTNNCYNDIDSGNGSNKNKHLITAVVHSDMSPKVNTEITKIVLLENPDNCDVSEDTYM